MIASGVIGSILSAKGVTVNATTVNNGISVASINKGQVVNVTSALRVRAEASTSSSVLGTMRNGTTFDIVSKVETGMKLSLMGKMDLFMEIMLRKLQILQQFQLQERL